MPFRQRKSTPSPMSVAKKADQAKQEEDAKQKEQARQEPLAAMAAETAKQEEDAGLAEKENVEAARAVETAAAARVEDSDGKDQLDECLQSDEEKMESKIMDKNGMLRSPPRGRVQTRAQRQRVDADAELIESQSPGRTPIAAARGNPVGVEAAETAPASHASPEASVAE